MSVLGTDRERRQRGESGMREVFLGEIIRRRRRELYMTQKQLCEGICEQATISRLENGQEMPSLNVITAILQRLGLPDERFYGLVSRNEQRIKNLRDEIEMDGVRYARADDERRPAIRERIMAGLAELEALTEPDDKLTRQFALRMRTFVTETYSDEEKLNMYMDAIRVTVPRFDPDNIGAFRYSGEELTVIKNLSIEYFMTGQHDKAIQVNTELLKYIAEHYKSVRGYPGKFCMVACCLSIDLGTIGRYDEAARVAERGWQVSVEHGQYQFLPDFIAVLAECKYMAGDLDESARLYFQAYYLYRATTNNRNREIIRREMKERLGLEPPY